MTHHFRSKVRNREALAIDPRADILDMLMAEAVRPNEKLGDICVVHVNGPLEHRACGYGDSYEQIRERFQCALDEAPKAVVLRIDSPGGVVSGLNQFVAALQRAKEAAGIPVYAYADELIASAAYAMACAADEIITPPSGIVGSIGVISLMADQVGADKKAGLNFVTITSGERKDDGHPHTPISDAAVAAETERVNELAAQFFAIVEDARGFDPEPLQAGIFTGADAVANGVADQVAGWDDLLAQIGLAHGASVVSTSGSVAQPGTPGSSSPTEGSSMLKLKALLAEARKALKAAKTEAKRTALKADISAYTRSLASLEAAYKKTTKTETKEEKTDDEEDEEAGNDTDREEEVPADDSSAELPEDDDEEESSEEDEKKASSEEEEEESAEDEEPKKDAKRAGKRAALADKARAHDVLQAKVARLEAQERDRKKAAAIASALAGHRITRSQAKMLGGKKSAFVTEYLSMHKTKLFLVDGEESSPREGAGFATSGNFSDEQMAQFRAASLASGGRITVDQLVENYKKNPSATNGVAGKA